MSYDKTLQDQLRELADENGEIPFTSNTRSLLDEAFEAGLAEPVYGKFRMIEPGCMNSIYRIRGAAG